MPFAAFPNPAVKKNILYLKQTFQCYCHYGLSNFREIKICCSPLGPSQGVQSPPSKFRIQYTPMLKRTWMRNKTDGNTGMTQNIFSFKKTNYKGETKWISRLTFWLRLCLCTSSTGANRNQSKPTVPYSGSSASNWRWQFSLNSTVLTSCALNKNK